MKHIINMPAATERLRDFCGLDQGNLMRIAAEVRKVIVSQTPGKVAASATDVHTWMTNPDNIRWGLYHVPTLRTVKDLLRNWDSLNKIPEALTILDRAKCEFGRDSLFEWPTKLNNILEKAQQNPALIIYIMETLFTIMLRKKPKPILCSRPQGERWDDRHSPVATPLPCSPASGVFKNVPGG